MNYIFANILGVFVFDDKINLADKILFKDIDDYKSNKQPAIKKLREKYNASEPDEKELKKILAFFKEQNFFNDFYKQNSELTKIDLKDSVKFDTLLIQSVNAIGENEIIINKLSKVLREWYELYLPELSKKIESHKEFAEAILKSDKEEILKELKLKNEDSLGADLGKDDLEPIKEIAKQLNSLFKLKNNQEGYITSVMEKNCPNIAEVATPVLGAKLIAEAGSLKRLSVLPASTVQILGAEKALFRHMKTGARMPKHGIIVHHPLLAQSQMSMHGKIARTVADKVSIAAKVDYFKGKYVGKELKKGLVDKFGIEY